MILIGSRALALRAPQALNRKPLDFDFVATYQEYEDWLDKNLSKVGPAEVYAEGDKWIVKGSSICEFDIIKPGTSNELLQQLVEHNPESLETPFGFIPTLDLLFTIKASHKYKKFSTDAGARRWWKTANDYHRMKALGAKIRPEYQEFLHLRERETYTYAHPKLNVGKDAFFQDDGIHYEVDHDDIHESVKHFDKPAYCYYLKDGEQVLCDKEKFFSCPRAVQIAGVIEEACVLAIERSLIPHPGVWSSERAWKFALSKVCSSITSGWFREFGYENLPEVLASEPKGYWVKFQKDREEGRVKPFTGKRYES